MNPKIDKMAREIEKTREKIAELQARAEELERQKIDAENTEIISIFRSADLPLSGIAAFIRAYKEQPAAEPVRPGGAPATADAPSYASAYATGAAPDFSQEEDRDEN